jgi:ribose-phosphate pyrophosphokinase
VVSPDVGGVVRARAMAKRLDDAELAIIDKRRPKANESTVMHIIGDVEARPASSSTTSWTPPAPCARRPRPEGARRREGDGLLHPPGARARRSSNITNSELDELVVTDTIPLRPDAQECRKIRQLSVAGMLAETIRRINREESVSSLFILTVGTLRA